MLKKIALSLIVGSFQLIAMDQPSQKITVEQAKEIVKQYVNDKEDSSIKNAFPKNSNYYKPPFALPGGSWLPHGYHWSALATKQCEAGIDEISRENDDLLIQCSESKAWERWNVEPVDGN